MKASDPYRGYHAVVYPDLARMFHASHCLSGLSLGKAHTTKQGVECKCCAAVESRVFTMFTHLLAHAFQTAHRSHGAYTKEKICTAYTSVEPYRASDPRVYTGVPMNFRHTSDTRDPVTGNKGHSSFAHVRQGATKQDSRTVRRS